VEDILDSRLSIDQYFRCLRFGFGVDIELDYI
jgi:hypothetical protein